MACIFQMTLSSAFSKEIFWILIQLWLEVPGVVNNDPGNGLVPNRPQAIIRTNEDQVFWRTHAFLCVKMFKGATKSRIRQTGRQIQN